MILKSIPTAHSFSEAQKKNRAEVSSPNVTADVTRNTWSLTLGTEASELFDSFDLWQIQGGSFVTSELTPVPAALSENEALDDLFKSN